MNNRFIAFDVETPNANNNRISAIGITIVENGKIVDERYTLVDPETHFDYFNIRLTGITPEAVEGKPNFLQLWKEIRPLMDSGLLIAHNAPFDMGVLTKCIDWYEIDWQPYAYYACTCAMGRKCYPDIKNHKLSTMCDYLGIKLNHHHAGSDSRACAELLLDYMDQGLPVDKYLRRYNLSSVRARRSLR